MKKIRLVLLLTVFFGATAFVLKSEAAKGKKDDSAEFHVKYDVTFESDDPSMEQALPFLSGSSMEVMKNKKYNKTIFKTGTMSTQTTILDNKSKKGIAITEGMMGNYFMKVNGDDKLKEEDKKPEIKKTAETTDILGYKCTKYVISDENQDIEIWTTPELKGSYESKFTNTHGKVEGFPLKIVVEQEKMSITMLATSYEDKVPSDASFSLKAPKGYTEKTAEDMKKMMGGGM